MTDDDRLDDYTLGAFVDGQLDAETRQVVMNAMRTDAEVRDHVCSLWKAKELMWLGFEDARSARHDMSAVISPGGWMRYAASICIVLILGGVMGGYIGYLAGHSSTDKAAVMTVDALEKVDRIVLHISKSDQAQFKAAMDFVRMFMHEHPDGRGSIAVIANAGGLDLLRAGVTPYEQEIAEITSGHVNVHFIACAQSIRTLRNQGIEPEFPSTVDASLPAFDQIIRRVEEGWRYISVDKLMKIQRG